MELGQDVNVKKRPRDVDDDEDSDVANTKNVKKEKHDDLCRVDKSTEDGNTTEHSSIETNLTLDSASKNERLLSEVDVGICEYIGSHCGFSGVIKQRHSDFLVTEIQLDGTEVKLDRLTPPEEEPDGLPPVQDIISSQTLEDLEKLKDGNDSLPEVVIVVENHTKDERRFIHTALKKLYPSFCSNTDSRDGKKVIIVTYPKKKRGSATGFQKGERQSWPNCRGNYTHFTLYKENIDTMTAVNSIAKFLRRNPGSFTYAGAKDKRGKTLQRVSIHRTEADQLLVINKHLKNIVIGNITYCKEPLKLGDLKGNKFGVVIRNVQGQESEIQLAMTSFSEKGFLNYYGLQRFGTTTVPTHAVGLALLKSDWKTAVDLILMPRPGENENMTKCRNLWIKSKDPQTVLNIMRNKCCIEAKLLQGLAKSGMRDLVNALNRIPRNSRLMYIHSYQSYLWNRILSKRILTYGTKVLKGDLVLKCTSATGSEEAQEMDSKKVIPTIVECEEDANIYEVVLPLFGYGVIYPQNQIADWYRTMLQNDGFDVDDIRHRVKDYSLSGSYRHIMIRPMNSSWSLLKYNDPTIPLILSDWDVLQKQDSLQKQQDGAFLAVNLEFTLPPSVYATMALREILRVDTSPAFQSSLNVKI